MQRNIIFLTIKTAEIYVKSFGEIYGFNYPTNEKFTWFSVFGEGNHKKIKHKGVK